MYFTRVYGGQIEINLDKIVSISKTYINDQIVITSIDEDNNIRHDLAVNDDKFKAFLLESFD